MAWCPECGARWSSLPHRDCALQATAREALQVEYNATRKPAGISCTKEKPMRPHDTCSITRPYTHIDINDALSEMPTGLPTRQALRFSAVLGLALGIGLAVLMMLSTWLSLSTRATARATTFVVHSDEQTLSADALEEIGIPPIFRDDIFRHF